MNAHLTRFGRAAVCATVLLLAPSAGQAAMLLPGTTVVLTTADILTEPVAPADVLASAVDLGFSTVFYTGSLTAAVVRNAGGTLDFYYQITNDAGSDHSLSRNTDSVFTSIAPPNVFTTEVFYRTDGAGLPSLFDLGAAGATPITSDRSADGAVVGFGFLPPATIPPTPVMGEQINPGETTPILVIRTNAIDFTSGFSSVLNGLPAFVGTFGPAPVAPIPEPASLLLLSSAFGAAGYMARYRARKRKPGSA